MIQPLKSSTKKYNNIHQKPKSSKDKRPVIAKYGLGACM